MLLGPQPVRGQVCITPTWHPWPHISRCPLVPPGQSHNEDGHSHNRGGHNEGCAGAAAVRDSLKLPAAASRMIHGQKSGLAAGSTDRTLPLQPPRQERHGLHTLAPCPAPPLLRAADHRTMELVTQHKRRAAAQDV